MLNFQDISSVNLTKLQHWVDFVATLLPNIVALMLSQRSGKVVWMLWQYHSPTLRTIIGRMFRQCCISTLEHSHLRTFLSRTTYDISCAQLSGGFLSRSCLNVNSQPQKHILALVLKFFIFNITNSKFSEMIILTTNFYYYFYQLKWADCIILNSIFKMGNKISDSQVFLQHCGKVK